ncbi:hypothetical protein HMPREF9120_01612, partial [Neisseria sp. oral taxon 020 str. F0370]
AASGEPFGAEKRRIIRKQRVFARAARTAIAAIAGVGLKIRQNGLYWPTFDTGRLNGFRRPFYLYLLDEKGRTMSDTLVRDYLQTQGLRLSADEVRMAHLAAQAVVGMGQAEIDRSVLWGGVVPSDYLPQDETTENLLKQVFMALDSAWDRSGARSAAVYLRLREAGVLLGLARRGEAAEGLLPLDEETGWRHLASRSAQ